MPTNITHACIFLDKGNFYKKHQPEIRSNYPAIVTTVDIRYLELSREAGICSRQRMLEITDAPYKYKKIYSFQVRKGTLVKMQG